MAHMSCSRYYGLRGQVTYRVDMSWPLFHESPNHGLTSFGPARHLGHSFYNPDPQPSYTCGAS